MLHSFDQQKADVHLKQVSLYLRYCENIVRLCFLIRAYVSVCDDGDPCTDLQGGGGPGYYFYSDVILPAFNCIIVSRDIMCISACAVDVASGSVSTRHSRESRKDVS